MSHAPWQQLSLVYLERVRRPMTLIVATLVPTAYLFASKHGLHLPAFIQNLTLVAAMLPFAVGGIVARSKADGSLAFIATLPVSPTDHARSWLCVVLVLCLPVALAVLAIGYMAPFSLTGMPLVLFSLSALALEASLVLTMSAVQLSAPPAMAGSYFLSALAGIISLVAGLSRLFELSPARALSIMASDWFPATLAMVVWTVAATAFGWSWRRIGHFMTSYVGEPPKA